MNRINRFFLRMALLPAPFYKSMGVHLPQLRSILQTKLMMDDRRAGALAQTSRQKSSKPVTRATIGTMIFSAFLGLIFLYSFALGADRTTHLTFYFSMFFFMLSATLISDFTSVLIDVRDTFIILPKPVNDKTFLVARLLHIFIHICKIVLPMTFPGIIFVSIQDGIWAGIIMILVIFLVTLFAIFFINAVYILILRISTPARFKSVISYFQIFFAIGIYASYQVVPKIIGKINMDNFSFTRNESVVYFPFYWFAAAWKVLSQFTGNRTEWITGVLGIIVPVVSLFIVIKFLAPSFNNRLAMINSSGGDVNPGNKKTRRYKTGYNEFLAKLFTRSSFESMGFLFTWKMMNRSRDFKMKVYPSIGYIVVYIFIMFYGKSLSLSDFTEQTTRGKVIIISAIYFSSFILTTALTQLVFSDKYKAAWFYYTTPLNKPGTIILGGLKAAICKFYIPLIALIIIASLSLVGPAVLPNLVLGLFNNLLIATLMVYASHKLFPFSMPQGNNRKGGSFFRSLFILVSSGAIAIGHFFVFEIRPVVLIFAFLSIIATFLMMGSIRNTSWMQIKSSYEDA